MRRVAAGAILVLAACPGSFELQVPLDSGPPDMPPPTGDPFQCEEPVAAPLPFTDGVVTRVGEGRRGTCDAERLQRALDFGGDIQFNCGPGLHSIEVQSPLRITQDDTFIDGQGRVTITGPDDVDSRSALFEIGPDVSTVVLRGLTLEQGQAPAGGVMSIPRGTRVWLDQISAKSNVAVGATSPGVAPVNGGGAFAVREGAELVAIGSTFTENLAGFGGAIWNTGRVALHNATFNQNFADRGVGHGGALANGSVLLVCNESSFTDNRSWGSGGAIFGEGGEVLVDRAYFEVNSAQGRQAQGGGFGGALALRRTDVTIRRTTFESNSCALDGGAVEVRGGELRVENTTFFENGASRGSGGALSLSGSSQAELIHMTALNNTGAEVTTLVGEADVRIRNSVLSTTDGEVCSATFEGSRVLQSQGEPCTSDAQLLDDLGVSSQLEGGVVPLQDGSAALGMGADCLPEDQRGLPRELDGCDLGAYEAQE